MSYALRKCALLLNRAKVSPLISTRSINIRSGLSNGNRGAFCAAGATIAAGAWLVKACTDESSPQSRSKLWHMGTSLRDKLKLDFNRSVDSLSKGFFGTVSAQKKKKGCKPCKPCPCKDSQEFITMNCQMSHSLYLWITLDPSADQCAVARIASDLETLVCSVEDPENADLVAGVGFGPSFYSQVMGKTCKNFYYCCRKCANGEMPYTGGDILLCIKSDDHGKLVEACKNYLYSFPESSIREFEDIYGYDYKCGKDLSNFHINKSNPCDAQCVAIECETGGSYALAQKWIHDFSVLRPENKCALEKYVGRDMCGAELKNKTETSHLTRVRGCPEYDATPACEIVQSCHSYGSLAKGAGKFFLGFANDPDNFEFMLDRMVGTNCDGNFDDIFKISKNVKGAYFYFPGVCELQQMKTVGCGKKC